MVGDFSSREWQDWRWQMRHSIRSPAALERLLAIPRRARERWRALLRRYPCRITPYYISLINWEDAADPLRRQCVPDLRENDMQDASGTDPLGEEAHLAAPGLVRRYRDRALALITSECALVCRHCTRKNSWPALRPSTTRVFLRRIVTTVARLPDIREVIVSGGDPLLLNEDLLDWFLGALRAIPHVAVLRVGTRVPAVLPMRITRALCACLQRHRPLWVNTQFNHPRELTPAAAQACERLLRAGLPVSNQAVLLRGVNDDFETLKTLCNNLQRLMVRPYYLFQCDPVRGAGHFSVPLPRGIRLVEQLRAGLGGLSMPQFVVDLPGASGKVPVQRSHIITMNRRQTVLRGLKGEIYRYNHEK
jgi:lysine 2,3-aminomutase